MISMDIINIMIFDTKWCRDSRDDTVISDILSIIRMEEFINIASTSKDCPSEIISKYKKDVSSRQINLIKKIV